jgi:zinc transport system substrate-binding protein
MSTPHFSRRRVRQAAIWLAFSLLPQVDLGRAVAEAPLSVFVSILPEAGLVTEIGGPEVTVAVLVGPGQSPETYAPTPRQMAALAGSRLLISAGVPFERGLLPRISGIADALVIAGPRPPWGDSGHGHEHDDSLDPHAWLDPVQGMALADTICFHLSRLRPASAAAFAARRDGLCARLVRLDREIQDMLAPFAGQEFFVFHPAFGHFARRYGLVQVPVEADGHEPGARQLGQVIARAKAAGARVIVVQPQFSQRSARAVARDVGAEVLVLDPLAVDYEANLRHIAAALAGALGPGQ